MLTREAFERQKTAVNRVERRNGTGLAGHQLPGDPGHIGVTACERSGAGRECTQLIQEGHA